MPTRIQRSRKHKYPTDGRVLTVTRPGRYGNPFVVCGDGMLGYWIELRGEICGFAGTHKEAVELAIFLYRAHLSVTQRTEPTQYALTMDNINAADYIACWCPIGSPCHGDVLIELAAEIYK